MRTYHFPAHAMEKIHAPLHHLNNAIDPVLTYQANRHPRRINFVRNFFGVKKSLYLIVTPMPINLRRILAHLFSFTCQIHVANVCRRLQS